ncbi:MAG: dihydrofolate reductase [Desulfuromonadales bacterium]|nr:dihydrofolate reductase [Desulfuromonadales bacterium]
MTATTNIRLHIPEVAIIVAMTNDLVIGSGGSLPWHLPEELQLFKNLTMGCTVIMGRRTYTSIGQPLQGRHNIVLSHNQTELPGVQLCESFITGLIAATQHGQPIFILGGEDVYRRALPIAAELHISWIKGDFKGDRFFPPLDFSEWNTLTEKDYPDFQYIHYHRRTSD